MPQGVAIDDLGTWCNVCQNTKDRGCGDLTIAANQAIDAETLHPVGAGLLGAGMAIAFVLILLLFVYFFGFIRCGAARKRKSRSLSSVSTHTYNDMKYVLTSLAISQEESSVDKA